MEVIQSMWVGSQLSAMEHMCIKSYIQNGHQFHLYVYQETGNVPAGTIIRDGNDILPASKIFTYEGSGFGRKSYAGFADMFRYKLLYDKGGWWVDTDSICLKPFDFTTPYIFSTEQPPPSKPALWNINCGNLKAPPKSKIYEWLSDQCKTVNPQMHWGAIGPQLMKRAVELFQLHKYVQLPSVFCPIPYDPDCTALIRPDKVWQDSTDNYAVHLWNEGWRNSNLDKDGQYPLNCLYERLKRHYGIIGTGPIVDRPAERVPNVPRKPPTITHIDGRTGRQYGYKMPPKQ